MQLEDRFPDRHAGSAFRPFVLFVKGTGGGAFNLTGATATWTLQKVGSVPAIADEAHSNMPGIGGTFEFTATAAQLSKQGEYVATITMIYSPGDEPDVTKIGLTII